MKRTLQEQADLLNKIEESLSMKEFDRLFPNTSFITDKIHKAAKKQIQLRTKKILEAVKEMTVFNSKGWEDSLDIINEFIKRT